MQNTDPGTSTSVNLVRNASNRADHEPDAQVPGANPAFFVPSSPLRARPGLCHGGERLVTPRVCGARGWP